VSPPRSAPGSPAGGREAFGGHVTIEDVDPLRCMLNARVVAIVVGRRKRRGDTTVAFALLGVGWLLLAQTILIVWD
jgi:hypothetical protein